VDVEFDGAPAGFRNSVVSEIGHYLETNGITLVASGAGDPRAAVLRLSVTPHSSHYVMHATLLAPDGTVVEETSLYHQFRGTAHQAQIESGSHKAVAQQVALLVVDDLLLIWHPADVAGGAARSNPSPARFTILADDTEPQSMSGATRLSWEPFPTERLLKGSDATVADISDVSYELRVHKVEVPQQFADRQKRSGVYRVAGLNEPEHVLPFILPSCKSIVWSVRARFQLRGHRRVTEWSGDYSTMYNKVIGWPLLPPYMYRRTLDQETWGPMYAPWPLQHEVGGGTFTKVKPPSPIKCGELERGFMADESKRATVDFEQAMEPLQADQSIAALASVSRSCISDKCGYEEGEVDASYEMVTCLAKEFDRRRLAAPVRQIADVLPALPVPPGGGTTGGEALLMSLKVPENRQYLLDNGIRYILNAEVKMAELGQGGSSDSSMLATVATTVTRYGARFDSDVIDASTGEAIGRISSRETGGKGGTFGAIVIVPIFYIPHGSISGIQAKACDAVARQMSFMLRGGVSLNWPDDAFQSRYDLLWTDGAANGVVH
jgi:hypothetical protein